MTCYHPLVASRLKSTNSRYDPKHKIHIEGSAKEFFISHVQSDLTTDYFLVPCGHCIGCRIDKARDWSVRCVCEALTSSSAWFVTLTFDDDHFGTDASIRKSDFQQFIKNVRNYFYYRNGVKNIRYFGCGEYGSYGRKHYHLILFNAPLDDVVVNGSRNGFVYFKSDTLSSLWSNGFVVLGKVNEKTAAYVARYTLKKIGKSSEYKEYELEEPFVLSSTRPGIGYEYCFENAGQILIDGFIQLPNGKRTTIPKYFLKVLDNLDFDVDKLRFNAKERAFDNEFRRYVNDKRFNQTLDSLEVNAEYLTKNRGVL